tara:strand:- start:4283 stop:4600 length:318 start_codon:yes stop_codon:yes gene_type:complete
MPNISEKYIQWRELGAMFNAHQAPSIIKVLESNNIPYFTDSSGKPIVERSVLDKSYAETAEREAKRQAVEKSLKEGGDTTSAVEAMDNMDAAISEFPTSVTIQPE